MQTTIVAEDPETRDYLGYVLRHAGFIVAPKVDMATAIRTWDASPTDLVILVLEASKVKAGDVERFRELTDVPLLIFLEDVKERQVEAFLEAGADLVLDYPTGPRSLIAYTRALLRRSRGQGSLAAPSIHAGPVRIDPSRRTVEVGESGPRRLTQLEFRLLHMLMTHRGQVLPGDMIVERVWGYTEGGSRELVRGLISRLRAKVEPDPTRPQFIHTVPGVGYLFDLESPGV